MFNNFFYKPERDSMFVEKFKILKMNINQLGRGCVKNEKMIKRITCNFKRRFPLLLLGNHSISLKSRALFKSILAFVRGILRLRPYKGIQLYVEKLVEILQGRLRRAGFGDRWLWL